MWQGVGCQSVLVMGVDRARRQGQEICARMAGILQRDPIAVAENDAARMGRATHEILQVLALRS
jgi:hypothetical protein